ncbi:RNA-directed DNA polymerase, eukaryota [Tanacetum coccineum]
MGIDDWQEVSRRKRYNKTKEDDLIKISTSIYVTNFLESFSAKDLFHTCSKYGHVIDSFIPVKKSKEGKRFGFVRFINVFSVDRLVGNLCTIWIGRNKLEANIARFDRPKGMDRNNNVSRKDVRPPGVVKDMGRNGANNSFVQERSSFASVLNSKSTSPVNNVTGKGPQMPGNEHQSRTLSSQERVVWIDLEGVPLNLWSKETFSRIGKKWGLIQDIEAKHGVSFACKRLCLLTNHPVSILEQFKIVYKGKISRVRAKELFTCWSGEAIVMGDFNEVRCIDERYGSSFNMLGARRFNEFIKSSGLVDINLEGYKFTWSHPSASKMSKLDRFLVTEGMLASFPSLTAECLDRHLSDHRPIFLHEVVTDFGPTPFRFYHSWFSLTGFDDMVEKAWRSFTYTDSNAMVRFKKMLQDLKSLIRSWVKERKAEQFGSRNSIVKELGEIDKLLDDGNVDDQVMDLDSMVTREEIRRAVWSCGDDKSPDQDGFSFDFYRKYWNIMWAPDVLWTSLWLWSETGVDDTKATLSSAKGIYILVNGSLTVQSSLFTRNVIDGVERQQWEALSDCWRMTILRLMLDKIVKNLESFSEVAKLVSFPFVMSAGTEESIDGVLPLSVVHWCFRNSPIFEILPRPRRSVILIKYCFSF